MWYFRVCTQFWSEQWSTYLLTTCLVLQSFANRAEDIAGQIKRHYELDTSYKILIKAVFEAIERVAVSHYKTPPNVIRFGKWCALLWVLEWYKLSFPYRKLPPFAWWVVWLSQHIYSTAFVLHTHTCTHTHTSHSFFVDLLSKLKIHSLDDSKDECKKKYRHYLEDYVVISLGRPLEKLSVSVLQ